MRAMIRRGQIWLLAAASGGSVVALDGCDPTVRDTVLDGVGGAATGLASTFISAFIQSLQADQEETVTTVRAVLEYLPDIFA